MLIKVCPSGADSMQALDADEMNIIWGFSCSETAGSASTAEIVLRHGNSASGEMIVAPVNFAADGFGYPTFFPVPILVPNGVYLQRVSGVTTVIIYWDKQ